MVCLPLHCSAFASRQLCSVRSLHYHWNRWHYQIIRWNNCLIYLHQITCCLCVILERPETPEPRKQPPYLPKLFANRSWKEHWPRRIGSGRISCQSITQYTFASERKKKMSLPSASQSYVDFCVLTWDYRTPGLKTSNLNSISVQNGQKSGPGRGRAQSKYRTQIKNPPLKGLPTGVSRMPETKDQNPESWILLNPECWMPAGYQSAGTKREINKEAKQDAWPCRRSHFIIEIIGVASNPTRTSIPLTTSFP